MNILKYVFLPYHIYYVNLNVRMNSVLCFGTNKWQLELIRRSRPIGRYAMRGVSIDTACPLIWLCRAALRVSLLLSASSLRSEQMRLRRHTHELLLICNHGSQLHSRIFPDTCSYQSVYYSMCPDDSRSGKTKYRRQRMEVYLWWSVAGRAS